MDKMTFPKFSAVELVNFFRQNVLTAAEAKNFTKADLYPNPKLEWVQKIYMRVLQLVFNIKVEDFYMIPVDLDIPYPHLVEGFAPLGHIVTLMSRLLPMCRVYDFHPSDVLDPKGKRTLTLLSGIVNFLHFRNTRLEVYSGFCMSYKSALDSMNQQQRVIQELEAKKEKLATIPPEQQAEFKMLSSDIHDLQQTLTQECRAKDMAFQEKLSQKKVELAEKTKKLNQYKLAIATMKEEQERMKSQIVESPEQRKNKTERMKENVHRLKQARLETIEKYEHYRERVTLAGLWQPDIQASNKKLHSIEANLETYKKIREEIRQEEEQNVKENLDLKSISSEETQLKRTILMKKEKLAKTDIKNQKKQEDFEQRKKEILEICSRVQDKRQAMVGRVSHVLQEIQQIKSKKEQVLERAEEEKKKCQDVVASFKTALEKYHDNLQKTFDRSAERKREKLAKLNRRRRR
ncbi:PREDICTED: kinetochore protein Nuf2 [Nanorana parkeri]|uniref:kinetochore protein Nuf2 n=1 Tax=Nanorana parkeri TaxID=125878 RepID=UPI000854E866|nr:PREDICTED: kinetochore protein Nuf2 [Nanorana parkeri]